MAPISLEERVASCTTIREHMDKLNRKILMVSSKEGLGKTTVTVGLAQALASMSVATGILDVNPKSSTISNSLPENKKYRIIKGSNGKALPIKISSHLSVAKVDSVLEDREKMIFDCLAAIEWGALEYLFIDTPAGAGVEHLAICKNIPELTGAIIVTTAQEGSILDVVRSVAFCRKMGIAILGIVENMSFSGVEILGPQRGSSIARKIGAPFLGTVPFRVENNVEEALFSIARQLHESMTCSTTSTG